MDDAPEPADPWPATQAALAEFARTFGAEPPGGVLGGPDAAAFLRDKMAAYSARPCRVFVNADPGAAERIGTTVGNRAAFARVVFAPDEDGGVGAR